MSTILNIGLFGVGHLGKIHLRCLLELKTVYNIVGFFDPSDQNAAEVVEKYGIRRFLNEDELIAAVDLIDIVTPTSTHFQIALKAIASGKHIFVEKPITSTPEEAQILLKAAQKMGIKGQVGFVERFNPAFLALANEPIKPMFIEAHRLSVYNPRGTDVSVVLDLMIHDLDILLKLVNDKVKSVSANGIAIVSKTEDIANARIEFENGAVANITASRISLKNMRKFRLFQEDAYISLDFLEKKTEIVRLYDTPDPENENLMELDTMNGKKYLELYMPETSAVNAIKSELQLFADSIVNNTEPTVALYDGVIALELAYQILNEIAKGPKKGSTL